MHGNLLIRKAASLMDRSGAASVAGHAAVVPVVVIVNGLRITPQRGAGGAYV